MDTFRNAAEALAYYSLEILDYGEELVVRGSKVKEITAVSMTIEHPEERCFVMPNREDNIFAKIAESLWVMSGSDDAVWLQHYLPRALDFSDDGKTWHAAYGKRLRHYQSGIDQLAQCASLLKNDATTRRAAMTIFNPNEDYYETKDVPCNNWIHWLIRGGKLHMYIAQRSSDLMWGFSGINTFEWSIMQMMMAHWCGVEVGTMNYFISSLHLYEQHWKRAYKLQQAYNDKTIYDGVVMTARGFSIPADADGLETFDSTMIDVMTTEKILRSHPDTWVNLNDTKDQFLVNCLQMLAIYDAIKLRYTADDVFAMVTALPDNDFKIAAYDYCARHHPSMLNMPTLRNSQLRDAYYSVMKV